MTITNEQIAAMEVGDTIEAAGDMNGQPWGAATQADWDVVTAYAAAHWPVQFEMITSWTTNPGNVQVRVYTVKRIR